jgi:hypothetical protein
MLIFFSMGLQMYEQINESKLFFVKLVKFAVWKTEIKDPLHGITLK